MATRKPGEKADWLCRECVGRDGKPYKNYGSRDACNICGLRKKLCFKQVVPAKSSGDSPAKATTAERQTKQQRLSAARGRGKEKAKTRMAELDGDKAVKKQLEATEAKLVAVQKELEAAKGKSGAGPAPETGPRRRPSKLSAQKAALQAAITRSTTRRGGSAGAGAPQTPPSKARTAQGRTRRPTPRSASKPPASEDSDDALEECPEDDEDSEEGQEEEEEEDHEQEVDVGVGGR